MVRTINTLSNPVSFASELPLKLARKCVDIFGYAAFDEEQVVHTLNLGCDEEIAMVTAGKEFGILKTVSGKVSTIFSIYMSTYGYSVLKTNLLIFSIDIIYRKRNIFGYEK